MVNDRWLPAIIIAALLVAMFFSLRADLSQPVPQIGYRPPQDIQQAAPYGDQSGSKQEESRASPLQSNMIKPVPRSQTSPGDQKQTPDAPLGISDQWWMVILTGVLACVGIGQANLLYHTLRANRINARGAVRSARAAERAAVATKSSADAARQTFIAGHRAWLRVDVTIGSKGATTGEDNISVDIRYSIKNIGDALATNITLHICLVPFNRGEVKFKGFLEEGNLPFQILRRKCSEIRRKLFDITGFILFPNEVWPDVTGISEMQYGISMGRNKIRKILGEPGTQGVGLFIIGCVDYTFPSDSANHHQTWFNYCLTKEIMACKTEDSIIFTPTYFKAGDGNVPKDDLMLIHDPFGMGQHAD